MPAQFGYDYSLKPKVYLLADTSFAENFTDAECLGFVYVFNPDPDGKRMPIELGFLMENEESAGNFLDALIDWVERSDGDSKAVNLEFGETEDGEYVLTISPNSTKLIERLLPAPWRDYLNPVTMAIYQAKYGLKISAQYRDFRDNYQQGTPIVVRYYIAGPNNTVVSKSERYFHKREFSFSFNGHLDPLSVDNPIINKRFNQMQKEKEKLAGADEEKRMERLREFYPVLYERLVGQGWLASVIATINKRYSTGQIYQGICNMTVQQRVTIDKKVKAAPGTPDFPAELLRYLLENPEAADHYFPEEEYFTKQKIEKQIRLDEKFVKTYDDYPKKG